MTQAEFKAWADKNTGLLVCASFRFFGNDEHVGEIYERALRSVCAYDEQKGKMTTFVYMIAWRCKWENSKRGKKRVAQCAMPEFAEETIPFPSAPIDDLLEVDSILGKLTERQREVAVSAMMGDTSEQIAARYGYSRQYGHKVLKQVREIAREMSAA
jgi:DNA-directed RNA polymerase specialized sigma24 family protein